VAPHASVAVQLTVVTPRGKKLPLGGVQNTEGDEVLQPPLAELLKKTAVPFDPAAVTVRFEEQTNTSAPGAFDVTEKLCRPTRA